MEKQTENLLLNCCRMHIGVLVWKTHFDIASETIIHGRQVEKKNKSRVKKTKKNERKVQPTHVCASDGSVFMYPSVALCNIYESIILFFSDFSVSIVLCLCVKFLSSIFQLSLTVKNTSAHIDLYLNSLKRAHRPASSFMFLLFDGFGASFFLSHSIKHQRSQLFLYYQNMCVLLYKHSICSFFGFIASWYIIFIHFWFVFFSLNVFLVFFYKCFCYFGLSFMHIWMDAGLFSFKQNAMRDFNCFIFNVTDLILNFRIWSSNCAFLSSVCVIWFFFTWWSKENLLLQLKIYQEEISKNESVNVNICKWIDLNSKVLELIN